MIRFGYCPGVAGRDAGLQNHGDGVASGGLLLYPVIKPKGSIAQCLFPQSATLLVHSSLQRELQFRAFTITNYPKQAGTSNGGIGNSLRIDRKTWLPSELVLASDVYLEEP